jgi:phenylacetate-CoA ligase
LIEHAVQNTSHYRRFRGAKALEDFPVLQKRQIRDSYDAFLSRAYSRDELTTVSTSGSYGTPLSFPLSKEKRARQFADLIYFTGWIGWKIGMPYLQVRAKQPGRLHRFLNNETVLDPTHLSADWFSRSRDLMFRSRARFLMGYPSGAHALAEFCRQQGDDPASFKLIGACLGGEPLTPIARQSMETTFGCPVRSRYAANELGVIGQESLEEPGRHVVNACSFILEILRLDEDEPAAAGQLGRIVVTDLYSHALPLIRYDTGDLGALAARPQAGSGLPVLERLEGRQMDQIFDSAGNPMCNLGLFDTLLPFERLQQFQLVQVAPASYRLRCVVLPGFDQDARVGQRMAAALGPGAEVTVERVSEIPPLPSGKRPAILNRMPAPQPRVAEAEAVGVSG